MSTYDPPKAGWPVRRQGGCNADESSCGTTWGGFFACCPGESTCPGLYETIKNNVCCPGKSDCSAPLNKEPHCANSTHQLYDRGFFCCEKGQFAFYNQYDFVGCSNEFPDNRNFTILEPLPQTLASMTLPADLATSPSTNSATATSTTRSNPASASAAPTQTDGQDSSSSESKTNVGAIAGGVVGGVAGLAIIAGLLFFFLRRNRKYSRGPVEMEASEQKSGDPGNRAYIQHQSSPLHGGSVPQSSPSPGGYTAANSTSPHPPVTSQSSPMSELENNQRPVELE